MLTNTSKLKWCLKGENISGKLIVSCFETISIIYHLIKANLFIYLPWKDWLTDCPTAWHLLPKWLISQYAHARRTSSQSALLPYRPFSNDRASASVDWQVLCTWDTSRDGFWSSIIVEGSVGWLVGSGSDRGIVEVEERKANKKQFVISKLAPGGQKQVSTSNYADRQTDRQFFWCLFLLLFHFFFFFVLSPARGGSTSSISSLPLSLPP